MKKLLIAVLMGSAALGALAQKPNLPYVDLSGQKQRQVVIAKGSEQLYNGHPTTVLLDGGKRVLAVWSSGHGGKAAFMAETKDGGKSWENLPVPTSWSKLVNCPSIYRLVDKRGKERLFVFCQEPLMGYSFSEDGGKSWSEVKSLGKPCVMAFSSIVRLKNGDYLGLYHRGYKDMDRSPLTLWSAVSSDGGLTWSSSVRVAALEGLSPCEPCLFYSPDRSQLVCIARENNRKGHSLMMFSEDEGKSWSQMRETPWGLTGDRHVARYLPDGRLVVAFRDMAPGSPTKGHFVLWVGRYKDLKEGTSGEYRVKLLHSFAGSDCGYPGLEVLPDGTILAITYIKYRPGREQHSIVGTRFKIEETDAMIE